MPTEGPNKAEELLQRYAKERRAQGGDFALHEATRRLLQGEVARQFRAREPQRTRFFTWLVAFRGWLALGGAVAAAVVLTVWMVGSGRKREAAMQLAKADIRLEESRFAGRGLTESKVVREPAASAAPAVMAASEELDRKSSDRFSKSKETREMATTAPTPTQGIRSREDLALAAAPAAEKRSTLDASAPATAPKAGVALNFQDGSALGVAGGGATPLPAARTPTAGAATKGQTQFSYGLQADAFKPALSSSDAQSQVTSFAAPAQNTPTKLRSEPLGAMQGSLAPDTTRTEQLSGLTVFYRQAAATEQEAMASLAHRANAEPTDSRDKSLSAEPLSRFTVEVKGASIRLTDDDQSVYEGVLEGAASEVAKDSDRTQLADRARLNAPLPEPRARPKTAAPAPRNYSFRASGSNVTLKQLVVVNGRLSETTAPPLTQPQAKSEVLTRYTAATNQTLTIEGTVRVGGTNEQRFRAYRLLR